MKNFKKRTTLKMKKLMLHTIHPVFGRLEVVGSPVRLVRWIRLKISVTMMRGLSLNPMSTHHKAQPHNPNPKSPHLFPQLYSRFPSVPMAINTAENETTQTLLLSAFL